MADKIIDFEASDLFDMGANFHEQDSSSVHQDDRANILDKDGNVECETMVNGRTQYTCNYSYCNASPDIKSDLSTHLTTFGAIFDSKLQESMQVTFEAGKYATVSVSGHNHDSNPHAASPSPGTADVSASVPSAAGFGVPTWTGVTLGDNADPVRATLTFSMNHVDRDGSDGEHFVGKNKTVIVELVQEFIGTPSQALPTDWTEDSDGSNDANLDADGDTHTSHRYFDLT